MREAERDDPPGAREPADGAGSAAYLAPPGVEAGRAAMPPRRARAAPLVLGALVIALQIAYPLLPAGVARDRLTVATVVVFFTAVVAHAAVWRGPSVAAGLVGIAAGVGTLAEVVGVATGVPFGAYVYEGTLGPEIAGVPVVIPMAWTMMAYPAFCVARRLTGGSAALGVPLGTWALVSWDLYLDPQMVDAGHWRWLSDGPAVLSIPLTNYLGWLLVSLLIIGGLWWLTGARPGLRRSAGPRPLPPADGVPYALYLWVWASSLLAHLAFFGLPGSALLGGIGMGVVAVPLAVSVAREVRGAAPRVPSQGAGPGGGGRDGHGADPGGGGPGGGGAS